MLPKNVKYQSKLESSMAKSYKSNIQPQSGNVFSLGDTIQFNIPTRNNLLLCPTESYLKFNVVVNNGTGAGLDARWDSCGAHGIISRIRVYHGSNLLSEISEYGLLAKLLFDVQVPFDASVGKFNILAGCRADLTATLPTVGALADNVVGTINTAFGLLSQSKISAYNTNSGDIFCSALANGSDSPSKTYCLNLISLVGSLCPNVYLPLFAMTSAPLRVEITLCDNLNKAMALTTGTGATLKLSNCEYVGNFVEVSDEAIGLIVQSLNGEPLQFCVPDYRNYQFSSTLNTSATQISFPVPSKVSSLRSLYFTIRDKITGADTFFPFSSVTKKITDYQVRIGSSLLPSKPPATSAEFFSELLKATASMSDLNHHPAIDNFSYTLQDSTANGHSSIVVNSGSFYIGMDLESYANSPKDAIFQGWNSTTDDIFLIANFAAQAANTNTRFDCFSMFDTVITCENNTCYVKY